MLIWGQCDWGRPSKNIHVRLLIAFDSFSTEHLLCIGYFKILSKLLIPLYTSDLGWFHVRTSTYLIDRLTSIFLVRIDKSSKHKTWIISNCSLIIYLSSATSIGHLLIRPHCRNMSICSTIDPWCLLKLKPRVDPLTMEAMIHLGLDWIS